MFLSDSQRRCLQQLAQGRGKIAACRDCGSQRVGVLEYESNRISSGVFRVALECSDCGVGAGDFFISAEQARNCGLVPYAGLPNTPETGI
jgi:hypothetical protein